MRCHDIVAIGPWIRSLTKRVAAAAVTQRTSKLWWRTAHQSKALVELYNLVLTVLHGTFKKYEFLLKYLCFLHVVGHTF